MNVLLDTNVFLRLATEPDSVPTLQRDAIEAASTRHLSTASVWEIVVKVSIGKLPLPGNVVEYVRERTRKMRIALLSVDLAHLNRLQTLPLLHRDPFDRLIVAQALSENLAVATMDRRLYDYGIAAV